MLQLIDSHAHLTDERFSGEVEAVVVAARMAGVSEIVSIASDLPDSERNVSMAESYSHVFATVGIHPHAASTASPGSFDRLRQLATHPKVVAIGETGLDFHYDNSPRDVQEWSFREHLRLAEEVDLPVVVHAREADEEVAAAIEESGWTRGVLHCFSGGEMLLRTALEAGWHVSFAGMVTFPKWNGGELLRSVPGERLLVETDSPYLAPVPHRGKRNEPAFVTLVARRVAEIRGEDPNELAALTSRNARSFFRLPQ